MAQSSYDGALDRQLLKKQAQEAREYITRPPPEEEPRPLFRNPVKKQHNDALSLQIQRVLGKHEEFQKNPNSNFLVGAPKAPATPVVTQGGTTFPTPISKSSPTVEPPSRSKPVAAPVENFVRPIADRKDNTLRPEQKSSKSAERDSSSKTKDRKLVERQHKSSSRESEKNSKPALLNNMSPVRIHASSDTANHFRQPLPKDGRDTKRHNGAVNGMVKPKLPPLHIPNQKMGAPELENIFEEMKNIVPPLTGIQTPRKEETAPHFPFTQNQQDNKHVANLFRKGSSLHDVDPSAHNKDKAKIKGLIHDLEVSESEDEDTVKRSSSTHQDKSAEHHRNATEMVTPLSSSDSSEGEDSSSDSSDDDSAASESEAETEPASQEQEEETTSWSLKNFMNEKPEKTASPLNPKVNSSASQEVTPGGGSIFVEDIIDDVPLSKNNQQSNDELLCQLSAQFQDAGVEASEEHEKIMDQLEKERDDRFDNHTEMLSSPETKHLLSENEFFKRTPLSSREEKHVQSPAKKRKESSSDKKRDPEKKNPSKSSGSEKKRQNKKSHKSPSADKEDKVCGKSKKGERSASPPDPSNKHEDGGEHLKLKIKVGNSELVKTKTESKPLPAHKPMKHNKVAAKSPRNAISSPVAEQEKAKPVTIPSPKASMVDKKPVLSKKTSKSPRSNSSVGKTTPKSAEFIASSDSSDSTSDNLSESSADELSDDESKKVLPNVFKKSSGTKSPNVKTSPKKVSVGTPPKLTSQEENNNKKHFTNLKKDLKKDKPKDSYLLSPEVLRLPEPLISPIYDGKNGISYNDNMMPSIIVKLDLELVSELLGTHFNTKNPSEKVDEVTLASDVEMGGYDSCDEMGKENVVLCDEPKNGESRVKTESVVSERIPIVENVEIKGNDENHERTRADSVEKESVKKPVGNENNIKTNASKEIPNLPKIPKRKRKPSKERDERSRSRSREVDVKRHKSSKSKEKDATTGPSSVESTHSKKEHSSSNKHSSSSRHKSKSKEKEIPVKKEEDKRQKDTKTAAAERTSLERTSHERADKEKPKEVKEERWESADFYRRQAKSLKHKADAMSNGVDKTIKYLEAILSFIMCGGAMEKDPSIRSHQTFDMYEGTLRLISHCSKYRGTPDQAAKNKKLQVLGNRLHAFIAQRLFKIKKSESRNLKKIIDDHNKMQQTPLQAPSPYGAWNKGGAGTPSPMSPTPSPASSTGSQGSFNGENRHASNNVAANNMSSPGTITVPQRIHSATNSYITNTHYLVQSHEYWELADMHTLDCIDFFKNIDAHCGKLFINNNSIMHLVRYVRYAIEKLNQS